MKILFFGIASALLLVGSAGASPVFKQYKDAIATYKKTRGGSDAVVTAYENVMNRGLAGEKLAIDAYTKMVIGSDRLAAIKRALTVKRAPGAPAVPSKALMDEVAKLKEKVAKLKEKKGALADRAVGLEEDIESLLKGIAARDADILAAQDKIADLEAEILDLNLIADPKSARAEFVREVEDAVKKAATDKPLGGNDLYNTDRIDRARRILSKISDDATGRDLLALYAPRVLNALKVDTFDAGFLEGVKAEAITLLSALDVLLEKIAAKGDATGGMSGADQAAVQRAMKKLDQLKSVLLKETPADEFIEFTLVDGSKRKLNKSLIARAKDTGAVKAIIADFVTQISTDVDQRPEFYEQGLDYMRMLKRAVGANPAIAADEKQAVDDAIDMLVNKLADFGIIPPAPPRPPTEEEEAAAKKKKAVEEIAKDPVIAKFDRDAIKTLDKIGSEKAITDLSAAANAPVITPEQKAHLLAYVADLKERAKTSKPENADTLDLIVDALNA